ncbi:MAG TPA: hypothetical protein VGZ51_04360, partial [Actinomycetota bacterium]|nr:hypothetical protein [Actinomycetota bacterium]
MDRKSSDTPFLGGPDTLEAKVVEHPFSFAGSGDKELNALVVEAVNRMGGSGGLERLWRALAGSFDAP